MYLNNAIWQGFTEGVIQAVLFAVLCFKSGLVTPSGPKGPPTFTFVRSKKKKERQSKKRKSFKAETIKKKGCQQGQHVIFLAILERLELKKCFC